MTRFGARPAALERLAQQAGPRSQAMLGAMSMASVLRAHASGGEGPPPSDPLHERERGVATLTRKKTARPPRFKVILYNDDYTPMEFVVQLLQRVFGKGPAAATQLMLQIHRAGFGVAGVYVLEVAETKVTTVHRLAEQRGYPLRAGVEKE
jgi:ATP-dependent Clp protease adaptor protein ClpS